MEVKLFANLADLAGTRRMTLEADGLETVEEVLEAVFERHPEIREEVMTADGGLRDHINVLVDGGNVRHDDGLSTAVDENAEVAIFPPVSGG